MLFHIAIWLLINKYAKSEELKLDLTDLTLSTLISGALGAVLGAVLGGAVTFYVHREQMKNARVLNHEHINNEKLLRLEDQKNRRIETICTLHVQLQNIHSNITVILEHYKNQIDNKPDAYSETSMLCQYVRPLANIPPIIDFEHSSLANLMILKKSDIYNQIIGADFS